MHPATRTPIRPSTSIRAAGFHSSLSLPVGRSGSAVAAAGLQTTGCSPTASPSPPPGEIPAFRGQRLVSSGRGRALSVVVRAFLPLAGHRCLRYRFISGNDNGCDMDLADLTPRPTTVRCAKCHQDIKVRPSGRIPTFCSPACRQSAFQQKVRLTRPAKPNWRDARDQAPRVDVGVVARRRIGAARSAAATEAEINRQPCCANSTTACTPRG